MVVHVSCTCTPRTACCSCVCACCSLVSHGPRLQGESDSYDPYAPLDYNKMFDAFLSWTREVRLCTRDE